MGGLAAGEEAARDVGATYRWVGGGGGVVVAGETAGEGEAERRGGALRAEVIGLVEGPRMQQERHGERRWGGGEGEGGGLVEGGEVREVV